MAVAAQSASAAHALPTAHGVHPPPQSTSVSAPFSLPSSHVTRHAASPAHAGSLQSARLLPSSSPAAAQSSAGGSPTGVNVTASTEHAATAAITATAHGATAIENLRRREPLGHERGPPSWQSLWETRICALIDLRLAPGNVLEHAAVSETMIWAIRTGVAHGEQEGLLLGS